MVSLNKSSLLIFLCWSLATGCSFTEEDSNPSTKHNAFKDPEFWHYFETQVRSKLFYGDFSPKLLIETFEKDRLLYVPDDTVYINRRVEAMKWASDEHQWIKVVLGTCLEHANEVHGPYSKELQDAHIFEAFEDYLDHLDYFQQVAFVMAAKGKMVHVLSQNSSRIHDIDKLDPVMLVGYSERFEDRKETSVWNVTVERHTKINPHHQANCVWHDCCTTSQKSSNSCEDLRSKALTEMVCDKVSRRLQKNLGGRMSDDMWNVEVEYFKGIPNEWVEKAVQLMESMKESNA